MSFKSTGCDGYDRNVTEKAIIKICEMTIAIPAVAVSVKDTF